MHQTLKIDDGYLGSGKLLGQAIAKHGRENFKREILFYCKDEHEMRLKERELITEDLLKSDNCYNLIPGGWGGNGFKYINDNPEVRARNRAVACPAGARKKNQLQTERRKEDPEFDAEIRTQLLKMSQKALTVTKGRKGTFTGLEHTDEAKKKIGANTSKHQTGSGNSQFGSKWMCHPEEGPKKVKGSDVVDLLSNGWSLGRSIK
jgi:hypothetical protein